MATLRRIILLVLVLLLAGCGQDDQTADTSATPSTSSTTTVAPTVESTTTTTPAPTTTAATTTVPHADQVLPGSFGTMGELYSRTNPDRHYPLNSQVQISFGRGEREDPMASPDSEQWNWEWITMTITYFEDLTILESDNGYREVSRPRGPYMVLAEDGTWYDISEEEGSYFGPPLEWADVQREAGECIESGAEVVGLEEVVGVATLHVSCELEDRSPRGDFSQDLWVGEYGRVMKSVSVFWDEPLSGGGYRWEVVGLGVEPSGPLPPGW
ncbi:MAG: hypothetical protein WBN35_11690 [Acidimicrobiia bacterium]